MKKFNGRSVAGSKGSCLLCWVFGNSLENLGKSTKVCKNKRLIIFWNFWKFSEIFESLRKSSKIFGKKSQNVVKCSKQASSVFLFFKSSEIIGSLRESSEVFGKIRKMSSRSYDSFWKFSKIFGDLRKRSEILGKLRKPSENPFECIGGLRKKFYNIPISDTCGLKIGY